MHSDIYYYCEVRNSNKVPSKTTEAMETFYFNDFIYHGMTLQVFSKVFSHLSLKKVGQDIQHLCEINQKYVSQ